MTTKTTKTVVRESSAIASHRPIVVHLGPGELLGARLKGTRKVYWVTVRHLYDMAVRIDVAAQLATKKAEREAKILMRGGTIKRSVRRGRRF